MKVALGIVSLLSLGVFWLAASDGPNDHASTLRAHFSKTRSSLSLPIQKDTSDDEDDETDLNGSVHEPVKLVASDDVEAVADLRLTDDEFRVNLQGKAHASLPTYLLRLVKVHKLNRKLTAEQQQEYPVQQKKLTCVCEHMRPIWQAGNPPALDRETVEELVAADCKMKGYSVLMSTLKDHLPKGGLDEGHNNAVFAPPPPPTVSFADWQKMKEAEGPQAGVATSEKKQEPANSQKKDFGQDSSKAPAGLLAAMQGSALFKRKDSSGQPAVASKPQASTSAPSSSTEDSFSDEDEWNVSAQNQSSGSGIVVGASYDQKPSKNLEVGSASAQAPVGQQVLRKRSGSERVPPGKNNSSVDPLAQARSGLRKTGSTIYSAPATQGATQKPAGPATSQPDNQSGQAQGASGSAQLHNSHPVATGSVNASIGSSVVSTPAPVPGTSNPAAGQPAKAPAPITSVKVAPQKKGHAKNPSKAAPKDPTKVASSARALPKAPAKSTPGVPSKGASSGGGTGSNSSQAQVGAGGHQPGNAQPKPQGGPTPQPMPKAAGSQPKVQPHGGVSLGKTLAVTALVGLGAWAFKVYYWDPKHKQHLDMASAAA